MSSPGAPSRVIFRECGCPDDLERPHNIAANVGYVFYCADCDGFLSLRNESLDGLIELLTKLRDGQRLDLGPVD